MNSSRTPHSSHVYKQSQCSSLATFLEPQMETHISVFLLLSHSPHEKLSNGDCIRLQETNNRIIRSKFFCVIIPAQTSRRQKWKLPVRNRTKLLRSKGMKIILTTLHVMPGLCIHRFKSLGTGEDIGIIKNRNKISLHVYKCFQWRSEANRKKNGKMYANRKGHVGLK